MEVRPLVMPTVDFVSWNTFRMQVGSEPATKLLDMQGINPRAPHALTSALDTQTLRTGDMRLAMVQLGFILYHDSDVEITRMMTQFSGYHYITKQQRAWECLMVANLLQWRDSLIMMSASDHFETRLLSNNLYAQMCTSGLTDLWYHWTRVQAPDKSFTFSLRRQ